MISKGKNPTALAGLKIGTELFREYQGECQPVVTAGEGAGGGEELSSLTAIARPPPRPTGMAHPSWVLESGAATPEGSGPRLRSESWFAAPSTCANPPSITPTWSSIPGGICRTARGKQCTPQLPVQIWEPSSLTNLHVKIPERGMDFAVLMRDAFRNDNGITDAQVVGLTANDPCAADFVFRVGVAWP